MARRRASPLPGQLHHIRGRDPGVTYEFMSHAVDRLWHDEDRDALRAKGHALVSDYVDRLFDTIGDARRVA